MIVSLVTPFSNETQILLNELNSLKTELSRTSQVDEFAKHSKLERKIIKIRQELETHNKDNSASRFQAKAAFVSMWRITAFLASTFVMYSYSSAPVYIFSKPYFYPVNWFISLPTGVEGGLGIPFYTCSLYYLLKCYK